MEREEKKEEIWEKKGDRDIVKREREGKEEEKREKNVF